MTNYNNVLIAFFYTVLVFNFMVSLYSTREYQINYRDAWNGVAVLFSVTLLGLTITYRYFPKISMILLVLLFIVFNYPQSKVIDIKPNTEEIPLN